MRIAAKALLMEDDDFLEGEALADIVAARPVAIYESAEQRQRSVELASEADREVAKQLALERRGETRRYPFAHVGDALRRWDAVRADGACIRSAAWDSDGGGRGATAQGDAAQRAAETIAPIAREWARLFPAGYERLTPSQARMITEWAMLGLVGSITPIQRFIPQTGDGKRQQGSKARALVRGTPVVHGRFLQGRIPEHKEIAAYASELFGSPVGTGDVGDIAQAGMIDLYRALKDCGLIPRSRKWDQMGGERFDIRGWKSIATHLGVSVRTAQAWHSDHALPVFERFGAVCARSSELTAWESQHTTRKTA